MEHALDRLSAILGSQAAIRLKRLATYTDGWDEGRGCKLSNDSLIGLMRLLELGDWTGLDIALFLSHEGRVLVNWLDAKGEIVELEVAKDYLTCFMAGEERDLPLNAEAVSNVFATTMARPTS